MSLERQIIDFCSGEAKSCWDVFDRFDGHPDVVRVIAEAWRAERLVRTQGPMGWVYRAAFSGVDIDAVHRNPKYQREAA